MDTNKLINYNFLCLNFKHMNYYELFTKLYQRSFTLTKTTKTSLHDRILNVYNIFTVTICQILYFLIN